MLRMLRIRFCFVMCVLLMYFVVVVFVVVFCIGVYFVFVV